MKNVERLRAVCRDSQEIEARAAPEEERERQWNELAARHFGPDPSMENYEGVRDALVERLKIDAAWEFNKAWLSPDRDEQFRDEALITADEIAVAFTQITGARGWVAYVSRDSLEELGPGTSPDASAVDALLRFIAWALVSQTGKSS